MSLHFVFIVARAPQAIQSEVNRFLATTGSIIDIGVYPPFAVIPANAGDQFFGQHLHSWIPAFAGTTAETEPFPPDVGASSYRAHAARSEIPYVAR